MNRALFGAVRDGAGDPRAVCAGTSAQKRLNSEHPVQVIKPSGHHSCWGVGQVKGVAQLVQGRPQAGRVVGPVELSESIQNRRPMRIKRFGLGEILVECVK